MLNSNVPKCTFWNFNIELRVKGQSINWKNHNLDRHRLIICQKKKEKKTRRKLNSAEPDTCFEWINQFDHSVTHQRLVRKFQSNNSINYRQNSFTTTPTIRFFCAKKKYSAFPHIFNKQCLSFIDDTRRHLKGKRCGTAIEENLLG